MRYYPCKLNLDNFHHTLSGCIQTIYTDSLLLTKHGFYKYIGYELYKYKISMDKKEDIVQAVEQHRRGIPCAKKGRRF